MWQDIAIPEKVLEGVSVCSEGSLVAPVAGGEGVEVWEFDEHYEWRGKVLRVSRVHVYLYARSAKTTKR